MTTVSGATVLVTGGQRGLGRAFVQELLEAGAAKVYATARTPVADPDPRVVPLPLEVTDADSVAELGRAAGDVSIVFNNAGIGDLAPLLTADLDQVRALFETNVHGALRIAQTFAPVLAAQGGGALVDIHSALSWAAGSGAYGATKAAFWSLTNSLRLELRPQGTQVLGVHLGYADTDMIRALDVPKSDPRTVAREVLTALEKGESEVLVDEASRHFKAALTGPVEGLSMSGR
ncbi:SDR family oxidoreductase [Streptomyces sp. GMY02]|uniref:SDR family oxidoreductase n=1 Tax=Streptomyces sp. GMY02 TaxID=1333528 RepID=UPI001C2C7054|nr:SDR family oxidoreductase [Streptomyces sp. GMY02]QXE33189.1 SDR family oxidoreductase [Streptomyces sp. GMY02]